MPFPPHDTSVRDSLFHNGALLVWLLAALGPSLLSTHPFYLAASAGLAALVYRVLGRHAPGGAAWGGFARLALFFVLFTLAFNVLLGGAGETVLIELPAWRVSSEDGATLFQLGGPVTLESLIFGLTSAAALLAVIYALATFNALADHHQLLRALPGFLYQAATVVSIALTFLPQLAAAQREIRQAQALRGHRVRGLRDLLPLLMTLLSEALDRAMSLAESMEARGFGGPRLTRKERQRPRLAISAGLALLLAGLIARTLGVAHWPWLLAVAGGVLVAGTVWRLGRRIERSRYRRQIWCRRDTVLAAASGLSIAILFGCRFLDPELLSYRAFPSAGWPSFDARIIGPLLLLLTPLALVKHPSQTT